MSTSLLLRSGFFLFIGLFLGRILGLLREMVLALNFGVSSNADLVIALVTLPDIIINIFIGNAAAAVFIPKIQNENPKTKLKFFLKLSGIFFSIFSLASIFIALKIDVLGKAILPAQANSDLFLNQLGWTLLAIPFLALNSISRLFLQNENKFFLIGMENVIFNIFVIVAIYLTTDISTIHYITIAIILGSLLRWIVQVAFILGYYKKSTASESTQPQAFLKLKKNDFNLFTQALSASLIVQVLPIFTRSLSSYYVGDGGLSIFNYVYKFSEFAIVLGVSIGSSVLFPKLSSLFSTDRNLFDHFVQKVQALMVAIFLPLSILLPSVLIYFAPQLVNIPLLQKMNFESFLNYLALCLGFLIVRAFNEFYVIVLNAKRDITTPLKTTVVASIVSLISIYFLTKSLGILGAFLGLNLFYTLNLALNFIYLFIIDKSLTTPNAI